MDARQNEEFTAHLRGAVREAERLKYIPTRFKGMLEADGGFETVKRILASGHPSDGFNKLWELGHLELTCEAVIVESKWRQYFDDDLLLRAERLLREVKYPFKRFELPATDKRALQAPSDPVGNDVDRREEQFAGGSSESNHSVGTELRINAFFRDVLHAPVANLRWSWGAVDERTRRVFLRLWRVDIKTPDGIRLIRVLGTRTNNGPGRSERVRHVELIRSGYTAFAVVCDKENHEARSILGFDHDQLLRLGRVLEEEDGVLSMEILGSIAVEALGLVDVSPEALKSDLADIDQTDVAATTRSALVDARLGQGRFRRELMRRWDGACAVTGCRVAAVLRASHCKPWREANNSERLDSNNGLILSANLDALFDVGLIGFEDDGAMIVADALTPVERKALAIPASLTRKPGAKLRTYLHFHRDRVFLRR